MQSASTNITTFPGKVGISNANPTHTLAIGSNVYVDDTGSNKLTVTGVISGDGLGISNIQTVNVLGLTDNVTRIGTLETDLDNNSSRISTVSTDLSDNSSRITSLESGASSISGVKTFEDDIILESNLRVNGSLTYANTVNMIVSDPIIELGANNQHTNDLGLVLTRHGNLGNDSNVAIFYDESQDTLKIGYTDNSASETTLTTTATGLDVSITGNVAAAYDTDETSYFGRAAVGYMGQSDQASFSHLDKNTSANFALKQAASGATYLNTPTGQHIRFSVNASEVGRFTGGGDFEVGTSASTKKLIVDTSASEVQMYSQATGSTAGPDLVLMRDNGSNVGSNNQYIGQIRYEGLSDTGNSRLYAKTTGKIKTATNGSEDGVIETMIKTGGSNRISVRHSGAKFLIQKGTDLQVGEVANLYVDTSTSRVGIGMSNPSYTLDVAGDINLSGDFYQGGSPFVSSLWTENAGKLYYNGGNVGIGTTSPQYKLDVDGGTTEGDGDVMLRMFGGVNKVGKLIFGRTGNSDIRSHAIESITNSGGANNYMKFLVHDGGNSPPYETRTEVMTLLGDGNVGIGTASPLQTLHVAGNGQNPVIYMADSTNTRYASGMGTHHVGNEGQRLDFYNGDSGANGTSLGSSHIRMSIKHNGNVGIGTSSPTKSLEIDGTTLRHAYEYTYQDAWTSNNNQTFTIPVTGLSARGEMLVEAEVIQVASNSSAERFARVKGIITNYHTGTFNMTVFEGENATAFETYIVGTSGLAAGTFTMKYQPQAGYLQNVLCRLNLKIFIGGFTSSLGSLTRTDAGSNSALTAPTLNSAPKIFGGNVGIGTTNPLSPLHIRGDNCRLNIADSSENDCDTNAFNCGIAFVDNTYDGTLTYAGNPAAGMGFYIGHLSSSNKEVNIKNLTGELSFGTRNLTRAVYINNDGNIGIGTNSPMTTGLHIANSYFASGGNTDHFNPQIFITGDSGTGGNQVSAIGFSGNSSGDTHQRMVAGSVYYKGGGGNYGMDGYLGIAVANSSTGGADPYGLTEGELESHTRIAIKNNGNVGIGTTNPGAKLHVNGPELRVTNADTAVAQISAFGSSQGTGRLYVGQSSAYGGGIEYNGDNSPASTGAGADYVTLYRVDNGTYNWTARNIYNNNNWEFRGNVKTPLLDVNGTTMSKAPRVIHIDDNRSGCPPTHAANTPIMQHSLTLSRTAYVYVSVTTILNRSTRADCYIYFNSSVQQSHLTAEDSTAWNPVNITAGGSLGAGTHTIKFQCNAANVVGCGQDWGGMQILVFEQ